MGVLSFLFRPSFYTFLLLLLRRRRRRRHAPYKLQVVCRQPAGKKLSMSQPLLQGYTSIWTRDCWSTFLW